MFFLLLLSDNTPFLFVFLDFDETQVGSCILLYTTNGCVFFVSRLLEGNWIAWLKKGRARMEWTNEIVMEWIGFD